VDFPPRELVYHYFKTWNRDGTLSRMHNALRERVRTAEGRKADPSAGLVDSQSLRAAETVGRSSRGSGPGAVDRARSGFGPPLRARRCELSITALDQSSFVSSMQLDQQQFLQPPPHPGLVPFGQPPPTGHARPEPQLLGQELPRDPGVQREQDPAQHLTVG